MPDKKPRILVVDDEAEIADLVGMYLQSEGMAVTKCHTGREALAAAETAGFDLAILDVMLPDVSGFTLCAQLRERCPFPILMLTAKTGDMDKINGLTIGADDYMTKPFNPLELAARVKAQLRRYTRYNAAGEKPADEVDVAGLVMNKTTHRCWLFEEEIPLTPIEFDILWTLCVHKGQVISAEQLFEQVWGEKYLERNNTVMVHIRRIREKLGDTGRAGDDRVIKTVWGVGYRVG